MAEKQVSLLKGNIKNPYANFDHFNGANCGAYAWSQSISDVEVFVPMPSVVKTKADVDVEMESKRLSVVYQLYGKTIKPVDGELSKMVQVSESMWTILPGQSITFTLEKKEEGWWSKLFANEEAIDSKSINVERDYNTLSEDDQTLVKKFVETKIMRQQDPSDVKAIEALRKAWNADNSPFKGQPFDPDNIDFTSSFPSA